MLDFICSTCGKRVQGDEPSVGAGVLCPACMAATAIATAEDAARAKITPHRDASDGSFREGAPPPPVPVPASLERQAIRGALIFAASGIGGAIMGSPCLFFGFMAQGAKSEAEGLMIIAACLAPSLGVGAALVGLLLRKFDSSYAGRVPVAGPVAFLVGALLGIALLYYVAEAFAENEWGAPGPPLLLAPIVANAMCGALFGAIRYSSASPPRLPPGREGRGHRGGKGRRHHT
jgi:hypothetical protein